MAQYGVARGLEGQYPENYDDETAPYTPAWSEKYTGIARDVLIRFAREWAKTAEMTGGKCTIVIGAGVNQWYHNNLMYRGAIHALMFTGCVGVNGGGLAHYVGQEKLAPMEPWSAIAFGKDWYPPSRLQNAPSWHYMNSDQWRYEKEFTDYHTVPKGATWAKGHTADLQVQAVRNGWLPFYPQFDRSSIQLAKDAEAAGAKTDEEIVAYTVEQLKARKLKFAVEDPDAPENWPRMWYIWRANALLASAKGHEFFLKHYLGTHHNAIAEDIAEGSVHDVKWHEKAPQGKMDLVVDLNFRMDSSALYSDIVLPAASWYEKADLNSTDMHSFVHPLSAAVPPCWESKSDWQIFPYHRAQVLRTRRPAFSGAREGRGGVAAGARFSGRDRTAAHRQLDRRRGGSHSGQDHAWVQSRHARFQEPATTSSFRSVRRCAANGLGVHGTHYEVADVYDEAQQAPESVTWGGGTYPSLLEDVEVCNMILRFATVTNGELAYRSYKDLEAKVGLPLAQLAEKNRGVRVDYKDLQSRPVRILNSPMWSGQVENGRAYAPFTTNVEHLVPWRTLTGRQHFYLDHPGYIEFGEHLPTYKPRPPMKEFGDLRFTQDPGKSLMLNYMTPHGKWKIHSTYSDNQRMTTLSRGVEPLWISENDAARLELVDNDWVEIHERQRRGRHSGRGERPHSARHLHSVPRAGAHLLRAEVSAAQRQAGRRAQQSDAHSHEAKFDGGRLRPVHLPFQLLGADGRQSRHAHTRPQAAQPGMVRGEKHGRTLTGRNGFSPR